MSSRHVLASALLFTALFACKGADSGATSKNEAEAAPAAPVAAPEPTPDDSGVESSNAAEAGQPAAAETETGEEAEPAEPLPAVFEQVGVDVCDQYVTDYGKCIDAKVPEAERDAARRIVFENVSAWKQTAAAGAAGQKSLQTACRIAREQAKRATQALGCEW